MTLQYFVELLKIPCIVVKTDCSFLNFYKNIYCVRIHSKCNIQYLKFNLFNFNFSVCSVPEAPDNGTLNCTGSPHTGFNCTIACNSGFSFDRGVKPYYECGPTTLFLWDFNSDDNPNGDLPTCNRMLISKKVNSWIELIFHF